MKSPKRKSSRPLDFSFFFPSSSCSFKQGSNTFTNKRPQHPKSSPKCSSKKVHPKSSPTVGYECQLFKLHRWHFVPLLMGVIILEKKDIYIFLLIMFSVIDVGITQNTFPYKRDGLYGKLSLSLLFLFHSCFLFSLSLFIHSFSVSL